MSIETLERSKNNNEDQILVDRISWNENGGTDTNAIVHIVTP
jgi:hypothetical protein